MIEFFRDLSHVRDAPHLLTGVLAGLLASVACGVVGPYVIVRRIVFLAGAIAHMAVGGVGAAIYLRFAAPESLGWLRPIHGGMIAAVAAALLIGTIHHRASERVDTLIGALWAIGMSVGILLMKFTPGYESELMGYLLGSIVYVDWPDVRLMLALVAAIAGTVLLFHKRFLAICLDEEQCALQGVPVLGTSLLLLTMVALTVICLVQVVGLILVLALLTLPAAAAGQHLARIGAIVWTSIVLSMLLTTLPRAAVYGTRISPESAIVIAAGAVYLASLGARRLRARRGSSGAIASAPDGPA
ncbi:MAG TPA: metal ABC transporter permease [Phycisphaerales bacterium]|nr:metal ABC transporter permease [Phycisphaerales bacterium]HMP35932.1 metal ABC transporter permease [Phycisphaerales bacterium]